MGSISKRRREHSEEVNVIGNEDRISNLPTSLVGHILSFLPTKNAVATSVLSTKWKYLWTSITTLDLDDGLVRVSTTPRKSIKQRQSFAETSFINFVYRVLTHNASDLQKFRLKCTRSYDVSHVNTWVSSALSRNPRELHLSNIGNPPRELFTCRTLVVLQLGGTFVLNVPTSVCLQCLKVLVVHSLKFLDNDSFYRFFSSCPVLENLSINFCDLRNISVCNISAPNLKSLTINCHRFGSECKYQIVLNTPNLQYLKYIGYVAEGYSLNQLNDLGKADISFIQRNLSIEKPLMSEFVKRMSKVQWLRLSTVSTNSMEFCRFSLLKFERLTYLELGGHCRWKLLMKFVEISPRLETLIFEGLREDEHEENQTTSCWYQPHNVPSCLLFHLKKIEIEEFEGTSAELKMVEYFLMKSRFLKKLVIHPDWGELEICKKLLMLPRSCPVEIL